MSRGYGFDFGCPACEWARGRGELRALTAEGCPICDGGSPEELLDQIAAELDAIEDMDAEDRAVLRVALGDLMASRPGAAEEGA